MDTATAANHHIVDVDGGNTLTWNGATRTVIEWSRRTGIPAHIIYSRLRNGWTAGRALTQPVRKYRRPHEDLYEYSLLTGIPFDTIKQRVNEYGWPLERALGLYPYDGTLNLTGRRFGQLQILDTRGNDYCTEDTLWNCLCDCGRHVLVDASSLLDGARTSCGGQGCHKTGIKEAPEAWVPPVRNGCPEPSQAIPDNRIGNIYKRMLADSGNRMCKEWRDGRHGFERFNEWSMLNGGTGNDHMCLTRDDMDVHEYSPENCSWIGR